jgi:hypothetical protein
MGKMWRVRNLILETEINNAEVLCFTEHWVNCHKHQPFYTS